jgi:hypothetical protein
LQNTSKFIDGYSITQRQEDKMAKKETESAWPKGLSQPAIRALTGAGYTRLEQLANVNEKELSDLHGMGPKGIRILRAALTEKGLSFAARQ